MQSTSHFFVIPASGTKTSRARKYRTIQSRTVGRITPKENEAFHNPTFSLHFADVHSLLTRLQHLWPRCVVFARMEPDDKINVWALQLFWEQMPLGYWDPPPRFNMSQDVTAMAEVVKYLQSRGLLGGDNLSLIAENWDV